MQKQKFYVVWKGRKTGIFDSWSECEAQVKGFTDAKFKSFGSREEAERAFAASYADFKGKPASSQKWLFSPNPPIVPSICVDAACDGSPGNLEYRGVLTETGEEIFHAGPFKEGTNNVGEFLALVLAMDWLFTKKINLPIYTDSETALAWAKAGRANTKLERTAANEMLFRFINRAENVLSAAHPFKILKWDTDAWGENPADFGRK
jgi:ribonuclease HI